MQDIKGRRIEPGQRVTVKARPCRLAKGTLSRYSGIVISIDELLDTMELRNIDTFGQHTAEAHTVSIQQSKKAVEAARRQASGEEPFKGKVTPAHKYWELYYKWCGDMMPRKRGLARTEVKK